MITFAIVVPSVMVPDGKKGIREGPTRAANVLSQMFDRFDLC